MTTKNNDKQCIVISFSTNKKRPLSGMPTDQNLIIKSMKKRTMSSICFEKNNVTPHSKEPLNQYMAFNDKKALRNSIVQQKKPVVMAETIEK